MRGEGNTKELAEENKNCTPIYVCTAAVPCARQSTIRAIEHAMEHAMQAEGDTMQ